MSSKKFKFIIPAELTKAENGEWKIRGLASTASRDQQGEVMLQDGMDLTPIDKKKGIINWDHKKGPENTLGVLDGYQKTPEGLFIEGRLFKNHDKAKAAYQIMSSLGKSDYGRMGLSVEGSIKERAGENGHIIKRSVITGVALTMNPVNTDTYVDLAKSLTQGEIEFDSENVAIATRDSEPSSASNEAQSPTLFTSDQVLDIVSKALSVGAERANMTPGQLSGGAALAQEDLDKDEKDAKKSQVGNKISKLVNEGKPQKQAVAIALDMERRGDIKKADHEDKIPGGLADKKKPSDFDQKALAEGIKVELEHTSDKKIAEEIAMDHLTEDPNYYKKLATIEKGSAEWFQKSILEAVDSLKLLYPDIEVSILLRALEDRLTRRFGVKDGN